MVKFKIRGRLATLLLLVALVGVGAGQVSTALTTSPAVAVTTNDIPSTDSETVPIVDNGTF